jgi:hypothetical protein
MPAGASLGSTTAWYFAWGADDVGPSSRPLAEAVAAVMGVVVGNTS